MLGHPDPVDHERDQVQPGQILGEQISQSVLGPGDESARDRRLGGAAGGVLDAAADRLESGRVATGGELGEHPLQRQLTEQLGRSEELVGGHTPPHRANSRPDPRAADPHPPAAEGHHALLAAVAHGGPVGVVAALGADQLGDVLGHQHLHDLEARPYRKREQAFAGSASRSVRAAVTDSGSASCDWLVAAWCVSFDTAVPFWSSDLAVARHLPHGRPRAGTASKFYGDWDNLVLTRSTDTGRRSPTGPVNQRRPTGAKCGVPFFVPRRRLRGCHNR